MISDNQFQQYCTALFRENTDAILLVTLDGMILDANQAFLDLTQFEKQQIVGQSVEKFIPVQKIPPHYGLQDGVTDIDTRLLMLTKEQEQVPCLIRKSPITIDDKEVGYFIVMKNMTDIELLIEQYVEDEVNYRMLAENINDVLILMDKDMKYLYVSPSSKEVFGFDHENIDNRAPLFNIEPTYVLELERLFINTVTNGTPFQMKLKAWHEERGWIWTEIKGKAVYDGQGRFKHTLLVARDISKEQEKEEMLLYFAYHDNLTGLANQRKLKDCLQTASEDIKKYPNIYTLIMLDIDDFKNINDSYGHEIGDEVIAAFASRVKEVIADRGLVARAGGDEFVAVLKNLPKEDVRQAAKDINQRVQEEIIIQQTVLKITVSLGLFVWEDPNLSGEQALRYADEALYAAKGSGKNQFYLY